MDVIVKLLLRLEEEEAGVQMWHPKIDGVPEAVVKEHLFLMRDKGLVDFRQRDVIGPVELSLVFPRLLNEGHDFLEAMRTSESRSRVARWAKGVGRAVTIDLVLAYIRSVATE